jgi:hypothetical protein
VSAKEERVGKLKSFPSSDYHSPSSAVIATIPGINHGLVYHDGYVYASSDTTVYRYHHQSVRLIHFKLRFQYTVGSRVTVSDGQIQTVITNLPAGGHSTRTLVFDALGRLYVSIGRYASQPISKLTLASVHPM